MTTMYGTYEQTVDRQREMRAAAAELRQARLLRKAERAQRRVARARSELAQAQGAARQLSARMPGLELAGRR
ncbi:MAG TPA: hypothetical protein VGI64_21010 [Streptosporangiaceae bacterium]